MERPARSLIGLGVIAALVLAFVASCDPRVGELNELLKADPQLAAYPYAFRVLELEEGVAVMSSPRSAEVPVKEFLAAAFPELRRLPVTDPAMMAAQQELAERQARAADLVRDQADVSSVRWELDRGWLQNHGVQLP
ncbi:MAG: hypothetical protein LC667_20095 [Thioalkalivibrio sp.]|nr:hypothetical protein [Thioalkalivibrio sp.]